MTDKNPDPKESPEAQVAAEERIALTPEKKQELLEAARAQALEENPQSTQKISPDMEAAPTLDDKAGPAPASVTPAAGFVPGSGDGVENFRTPVYGPYSDYQIVMTPWGEFGCPKGEVLWFEAKAKFSPKSGEFIVAHLPRHATPKDAPAEITEMLGAGAR